MNHWVVLAVVLPLLSGSLLILLGERNIVWQRALNLLSCAALLALSVHLLILADSGEISVYLLGNWLPNIGISLVLDRLSALMVGLTALLGLVGALFSCGGSDLRARWFHALWQFQLMGLCGAFLTADLFNLFVFFEVLLISSYGLLLHGAHKTQLKRGFHYVTFNLVGSCLFLIAVATLYGMLGTLSMADLAYRIAGTTDADAPFVKAAGLLLLVVFAIKAALLPLYFWLPRTYAAAPAAVAILFALMTKVGVYSILRVYPLLFGDSAGALEDLALPVLLPAGLLTLLLGAVGAFAARRLRSMIGYLVVASAGTMLLLASFDTALTLGAALYYMVHSALAVALLFALADLIKNGRGEASDSLIALAALDRPAVLGTAFFVAAMAAAAMPPLSGFLAKALLLQAIAFQDAGIIAWVMILISGLLIILALVRAGSHLFWRKPKLAAAAATPSAAQRFEWAAVFVLLTALVALSVLAAPVVNYTQAAGAQLKQPDQMVLTVLKSRPVERAP